MPPRAYEPPTHDGPARPGAPPTPEPLSALLRDLAESARNLARDEVQLAKAEVGEKVRDTARHLVPIAAGALLALVAVFMLATAAATGLTSLLAQVMSMGVAVWLSPLLLAIALGAGAWLLVQRGKKGLQQQSLVPEKTKESLREDKEWIKEKLS